MCPSYFVERNANDKNPLSRPLGSDGAEEVRVTSVEDGHDTAELWTNVSTRSGPQI